MVIHVYLPLASRLQSMCEGTYAWWAGNVDENVESNRWTESNPSLFVPLTYTSTKLLQVRYTDAYEKSRV